MADYGVNINLRVKGQSGLDRLQAKVKQLSASIDKMRGVDIMNPRNTGGAGGRGARNEIRKYRQDMEALVKSVNNSKSVFGKTANQQIAAAEALQEYSNELIIGTKAHKAATSATEKQIRAIDAESTAIAKNNEMRRKNKDLASRIGGGNQFRGGMNPKGNKAALTSGLISGAFPLLFGQGLIGGAAGFAGGFGGTKIAGQMGGFAGGLVATAILQQLTTAIQGLNELGKALDPKTLNIDAVSKSFGLLGTDTQRYLKLIEQTEGKQAAYNLAVEETTKLVGQDGVEALQAFADSSQNLTNEMSKFFTRIGAEIAKLAQKASGGKDAPILGFERSNLLAQAKQVTDDKEIMDLVKQRENANRNIARQLDNQIVKLMKAKNAEDARTRAAELAKLEYEQITKSLTDQIEFLNNSITVGRAEAEIIREKTKIIEAAKKANLKFDEAEIDRQVRLKRDLQKVNNLYASIGSTIENGLVNAIQGAIDGTSTLGDVARSVFGEISRQLISFGVNAFLGGLFPNSKFFRANGGVVSAGKSYMVGERGAEMFVPNTGGRIVPNSDLGGSTNIVVNVDASGSSVEGNEGDGRELGRLISVAVQSEIIQQQRPGGLLA